MFVYLRALGCVRYALQYVSVTCAQKCAVGMGANVLKFAEEVLIFEFSKQAMRHEIINIIWLKKKLV